METKETTFDKSQYNPTLFKLYKVTKKLVKYAIYIGFIYLSLEAVGWLLEN